MATKALLNFIRRSPLHRFIVGFLTIFTVLSVGSLIVLYPARAIYYGWASGDYLLNVSKVTAETEITPDENLDVSFCRSPRARVIAYNNIRSFYLVSQNHLVYQRELPDGIEYEKLPDDGCVVFDIKPENRPNTIGTYKFCQSLDFTTEYDQKKTATFCSTEYNIVPKKGVITTP